MTDRQQSEDQEQSLDPSLLQMQPQQPLTAAINDEMLTCVAQMEAALLPCLPARELQAIDRSPHPSHQIDVERHARDFMEAAKKLQQYFIALQREEPPSKAEMLKKEIGEMQEEVKVKDELIKKQEQLVRGWKVQLKELLEKHRLQWSNENSKSSTNRNIRFILTHKVDK